MTDDKKPHLKLVKSDKPKAPRRAGSGGPGNPHVPTEANRVLVGLAKGSGFTEVQIANLIGISDKTLRAHYAKELSEGADRINLKIAANLASIASDRTHPKAVTAAIYWTKARMGWADTSTEEDDEDEAPVEFTIGIGEKRGTS